MKRLTKTEARGYFGYSVLDTTPSMNVWEGTSSGREGVIAVAITKDGRVRLDHQERIEYASNHVEAYETEAVLSIREQLKTLVSAIAVEIEEFSTWQDSRHVVRIEF